MSKRIKNDFYPTLPKLTQAITNKLSELVPAPAYIIESSGGTGEFIRAARTTWPTSHIMGVDVDPIMGPAMAQAGADQVVIGDWREVIKNERDLDVLILGNDPFKYQISHITAGLQAQGAGTFQAKIGRFSLMGSRERIPFWQQYPARLLFPLVPRPNFMEGMIDEETGEKKGGDNSEYMLYVWQKGYQGYSELRPPLVWK